MIGFFTIIYLFLINIYFYRRKLSFLHPAFLTSIIWLVLVSLYETIKHGLYPLIDNTYLAICIWVSVFCFFSYNVSYLKISIPSILKYRTINPFWTRKSMMILYIVCMVILVYSQYKIGASFDAGNSIAGMRSALQNYDENLPLYFRLLNRVEVLIYVVFWGIISSKSKNNNKLLTFLLGLLIIVFTLLLATKGKIIEFFLTYFLLQYKFKKINVKYIILGFGILIFLLAVVILNRDDSDFGIIDLGIIYLFSPLTALSEALSYQNFIPSYDLRYSLGTLSTIIAYFDPSYLKSAGNAIDGWINVPFPTNVYTIIYNFYRDFGWFGIIIMGTILGIFWGIIYNFVRHNIKSFTLCYAILYYMLIFQFFGDWLFSLFSLNMQIIFYSIFIFLRFKIKG